MRQQTVAAHSPHTLQRAQTLDITCNKPCNTLWNNALVAEGKGKPAGWAPQRRDIPRIWAEHKIFEQAYSKENILAGWKANGFHPWNRAAITDEQLRRATVPDAEERAGVVVDDAVAAAEKVLAGQIPDDPVEMRRLLAAMAKNVVGTGEVCQRQRVELHVKEAAGVLGSTGAGAGAGAGAASDDDLSDDDDEEGDGKKKRRYFSTFGLLTAETAREEKRAKAEADRQAREEIELRKAQREAAKKAREEQKAAELADKERLGKGAKKCGCCGKVVVGHNKSTCPERDAMDVAGGAAGGT